MVINEGRAVRYRDRWTSDWTSTALGDNELCAAFDDCGIQANVESRERHAPIHGRRLSIHCTDGTHVSVAPDRGMSYWTVPHALARQSVASFEMDDVSAEYVAKRLPEIRISVQQATCRRSSRPTGPRRRAVPNRVK